MDGQVYFLIFLAATVISAPIAIRCGLGSVLGYLLAGVVLGPLLRWLSLDVDAVSHITEYGVILMLFLIGLELQPSKLWDMRGDLLGLGSAQVLLTSLVFGYGAYWFGFSLSQSAAIGMIASLSSTAIVLQSLREIGFHQTRGGQAAFGVLLLQDIAVILMLAIMPFLAFRQFSTAESDASETLISGWPVEAQGVIMVLVVGFIFVAGRHFVNPLFRFIARSQVREIFTAAALLLVLGVTFAMQAIGLSPALGAFLGGVVLSSSEYRHQLENDINPFKGLLLAAFFISIGAGIQFDLLLSEPTNVVSLVLGLMAVKVVLYYLLGFLVRMKSVDRWLFALGMAQVGEFSLVLLTYAGKLNVLRSGTVDLLTLATTLSMLLTPVLFILFTRFIAHSKSSEDIRAASDPSAVDIKSKVIIAGAGRFGQIIVRQLHAQSIRPVIIDYNVDQIEGMAKLGVKVFYGDAGDEAMLEAAGIADADLFVAASDEGERQIAMVANIKKNYPEVKVIARAHNRTHYYRLRKAGADCIIRELFGSSNYAAEAAMTMLGSTPDQARAAVQKFRAFDEQGIEKLYQAWSKEEKTTPLYFDSARSMIEEFENTIRLDRHANSDPWDEEEDGAEESQSDLPEDAEGADKP